MGKLADRNTKRTHLEQAFEFYWSEFGDDRYCLIPQYKFPKPERQWRFDYAYEPGKIIVEIEGGIWIGGGHSRGSGVIRDIEKHNAAVLKGWRVLRVTSDMINQNPYAVIQMIEQLIALVEKELNNGHGNSDSRSDEPG